jgi:hypothetical protein
VDRLKRIDWIGLLFSVGGLVCWVMAINFGGTRYVSPAYVLKDFVLT